MTYFVLLALSLVSLLSGIIPVYSQYVEDTETISGWPPGCITEPEIKCPLSESSLNVIVEPIYKSEVVLVGKIIETKLILKQNQTEYGIKVDKYLKTVKPFDLITAVGDGIYKKNFFVDEVTYYNTPIFKKDDRVFVYLNSENGTYKISPYSFAISKNIPIGPPPENSLAAADKSEYHNKEIMTISGSIKKAYIFESSLRNQSIPVHLTVYNPSNQVYENRTLYVRSDGTFNHSFRISGGLGISGQYEYDVKIGSGTWSGAFLYSTDRLQSPLQQYKRESRDDIKCQTGLEILKKSKNGFPACVKPQTKTELIKRGWGSETWPFSSIVENKTSCSIIPEITPGPYQIQSCPATSNTITTTTLNRTGFASVHRTSILTFADNYVLEPGHNGTITYSLGLSDAVLPDWLGDIPSRSTNLTNYVQFIHYKTLDLKDLENYPDTTLKKDSTSFATCFETPYNPSCIGDLTTSNTVNAFVYDHPGVTVHFDKQYELLTKDHNTTLAVTFSASKDAVPGTYIVILPQGTCSGGLILLTIGDCPYQVNVNDVSRKIAVKEK